MKARIAGCTLIGFMDGSKLCGKALKFYSRSGILRLGAEIIRRLGLRNTSLYQFTIMTLTDRSVLGRQSPDRQRSDGRQIAN